MRAARQSSRRINKAMKTQRRISTVLHTRTHINRTHRAFAACFCSLALILGSPLCLAQTCSPTPAPTPDHCPPFNFSPCPTPAAPAELDPLNPTPDPPLEVIPPQFQPPDGSMLQWRKYIPAGTSPFPTVLVVHTGGWHSGSPTDAGGRKGLA